MEQATAPTEVGKSSTGMQANFAALLAYVFGLVTGLVFFLVEKESKFVKFHAMQSICFSIAFFVAGVVLAFIPIIGWAIGILLNLGGIVLWIVCMVQAYQGKWFRLPVVGDFAAKQVGV
jgi:uncharacterized membrane protein